MNKLTEEEFNDRVNAIQRARRIFIETGLTNNITIAFQVYQEILAEQEREVFINTFIAGNRLKTPIDNYERPKCPDCSFDMMFRQVGENSEGIKIQLVCSNVACNTVLNSDNDLDWWMKNLKAKE